jgi:selenium metabolism protein YedF
MRCLDHIEQATPQALTVLVDDPGARENVARLLAGKGYVVTAKDAPGHTELVAVHSGQAFEASPKASPPEQAEEKITVFIPAETIGAGSDELGGKLMLNFLATLPELGQGLWRIVLVNGGVKLATTGHPCLEKLLALAENGVSVLVCGTCLSYFGLMEAKAVGETTNMLDVVSSMQLASKVIRA